MTRKGVWNLQQVRDKYLQSLWANDTQLWVWGANKYGTLGLNQAHDSIEYSSPVQIPGTDWGSFNTNVGKTDSFVHNIKEDGTLWLWGRNNYGMLGQNSRTDYSSPVQLPGSWSTLTKGNYRTSGIKTDNTAWVWGSGTYSGELGLNDTIDRSSPTQIPGSWSNVNIGAAGLGLKTDGTLWSWGGSNTQGQLGQNNRTQYSSPVQIDAAGVWDTVSSFGYGTLATKKSLTPSQL